MIFILMENSFNPPTEILAQPLPMNASPEVAFDPKKRLKHLLSIPERDRSDEEWDEIIELEIQLAPGNRSDGANVLPNKIKNKPLPLNSVAALTAPHNKKRPRANNFRRMRGKPGGNNPAPAANF